MEYDFWGLNRGEGQMFQGPWGRPKEQSQWQDSVSSRILPSDLSKRY